MNDQADALAALARQVLNMLKLQRAYFNSKKPTALQEAKDAERRMELRCKDILFPPPPSLFGDGGPK